VIVEDRQFVWLIVIAYGLLATASPVFAQVLYLVTVLPTLWILREQLFRSSEGEHDDG